MSKFNKNRSVYYNWLNVPVGYVPKIKSQHTEPKYDNTKELTFNDIVDNENLWNDFINNLPDDVAQHYADIDNYFEAFKFIQKYANKVFIPEYNKTHKVKKEYYKEFVVIEFYGKHYALCGWRNMNKCNVGVSFLCPIIIKNKQRYIKYKNQLINIEKDIRWVF